MNRPTVGVLLGVSLCIVTAAACGRGGPARPAVGMFSGSGALWVPPSPIEVPGGTMGRSECAAVSVAATEVPERAWVAMVGTAPPSCEWANDCSTSARAASGMKWLQAVEFANLASEAHGLHPAYEIDLADGERVRWSVDSDGYRLLAPAEWNRLAEAAVPDIDPCDWSVAQEYFSAICTSGQRPTMPMLFASVDSGQSAASGHRHVAGNVAEWGWPNDEDATARPGNAVAFGAAAFRPDSVDGMLVQDSPNRNPAHVWWKTTDAGASSLLVGVRLARSICFTTD